MGVYSCVPHDDLQRAAQVMWEHDCGTAPVVGPEQHVVGVITDRDIYMAAYTRGLKLWQMDVGSTMAKRAHAVRGDDALEAVEAVMCGVHVHRVPVLDRQGKLAGILSIQDLAQAHRRSAHPADGLEDQMVVRTIAEICRRSAVRVISPDAKVVSDVMTRPVQHCRASDRLDRVAGVMWNHGRGAIPVVADRGRTIGMVTDRDVCMAAYTRGQPCASCR